MLRGGYSWQVTPSALGNSISTSWALVDGEDPSTLGNFQDQGLTVVISRPFVVFQLFDVNATEHGLISAN